jgi:hypothetical protein
MTQADRDWLVILKKAHKKLITQYEVAEERCRASTTPGKSPLIFSTWLPRRQHFHV